MSPVLAIDLALKSYSDFGVVLVERSGGSLHARIERWTGSGAPDPRCVADRALRLAERFGVKTILIDGTQAWKDPMNGLAHCRVCEKVMHTPSKTGPPGECKPRNYLGFTVFSIAVFDALDAAGFPRLSAHPSAQTGRVAIETFPFRAWRSLGLSPLPAKAKATSADVQRCALALQHAHGLSADRIPTHDELQAMVTSLAGVALSDGSLNVLCAGVAPFVHEGFIREGFIVIPGRNENREA